VLKLQEVDVDFRMKYGVRWFLLNVSSKKIWKQRHSLEGEEEEVKDTVLDGKKQRGKAPESKIPTFLWQRA